MLKMALLDCAISHSLIDRSIKNVAALTEDGVFALFNRPHPGGFDRSRVPTPGNLPSKAKKMLMPGGQPGGVLGAGGIDWCINGEFQDLRYRCLSLSAEHEFQGFSINVRRLFSAFLNRCAFSLFITLLNF